MDELRNVKLELYRLLGAGDPPEEMLNIPLLDDMIRAAGSERANAAASVAAIRAFLALSYGGAQPTTVPLEKITEVLTRHGF